MIANLLCLKIFLSNKNLKKTYYIYLIYLIFLFFPFVFTRLNYGHIGYAFIGHIFLCLYFLEKIILQKKNIYLNYFGLIIFFLFNFLLLNQIIIINLILIFIYILIICNLRENYKKIFFIYFLTLLILGTLYLLFFRENFQSFDDNILIKYGIYNIFEIILNFKIFYPLFIEKFGYLVSETINYRYLNYYTINGPEFLSLTGISSLIIFFYFKNNSDYTIKLKIISFFILFSLFIFFSSKIFFFSLIEIFYITFPMIRSFGRFFLILDFLFILLIIDFLNNNKIGEKLKIFVISLYILQSYLSFNENNIVAGHNDMIIPSIFHDKLSLEKFQETDELKYIYYFLKENNNTNFCDKDCSYLLRINYDIHDDQIVFKNNLFSVVKI